VPSRHDVCSFISCTEICDTEKGGSVLCLLIAIFTFLNTLSSVEIGFCTLCVALWLFCLRTDLYDPESCKMSKWWFSFNLSLSHTVSISNFSQRTKSVRMTAITQVNGECIIFVCHSCHSRLKGSHVTFYILHFLFFTFFYVFIFYFFT